MPSVAAVFSLCRAEVLAASPAISCALDLGERRADADGERVGGPRGSRPAAPVHRPAGSRRRWCRRRSSRRRAARRCAARARCPASGSSASCCSASGAKRLLSPFALADLARGSARPAAATSSARSRSGGRWIGNTFSRYSRSSRSLPLATACRRIAVGGGDDAHVGLLRLGRADAHEGAGLEHAQQLDLQLERHLGDLVEEQRAAVGALEEALVLAVGAGEAALLVAEELAFDQVAARSRRS